MKKTSKAAATGYESGNPEEVLAAGDRKVMPFDTITVYSTDKVQDIYPKVGTPITLHPEAARKLVAAGKATETSGSEAETA